MADDAYARRNRRKQEKGFPCAILVALAGALIGLGYFLNSVQGWVL